MIPLKRYTPWSLALIFGVLYLLTPTALYYWDGIVFATLCEQGTPHELIHPHHLLYNLVIDICYELVRLHFPTFRSLPFLIWVSSIFGALTIYFSHLIFRSIFHREGLAAATTSFMGFSFTFWHYSTDANAYIISAFFPVLMAYLMISMNESPKPRVRLVWISLLFSIGMLIHQVVVLFLPVYVFWIFAFRFKNPKIRFPFMARIALIMLPLVLTAGIYFLIGHIFFQYETFSEYFAWITAYGHQARWWFGSANSGFYPFAKAVTLSHLKLMFYPDYIRYGLFNFSHLSVEDIAKKILAILSLLTVFLVFIRGFIYLIGAIGRRRFYAALLLTWIIPYFVFFTFFTPQFEFYRLYYFLPVMTIFALGLKGFFEKPTYEHLDLPISPNTLSGWVFVLLMIFATYNGVVGIHPQIFPSNNSWLMDARAFIKDTPQDSVMVVPWSDTEMEEYSRVANLVRYFGTQGVLFAKPVIEIVGPMEEFVGPPLMLDDEKKAYKWEEVEIRPGMFPDIERAYFHEKLLDGYRPGYTVFNYRFPDTRIPLEGIVVLPRAENCSVVNFGSIKYHKGENYYLKISPEEEKDWLMTF